VGEARRKKLQGTLARPLSFSEVRSYFFLLDFFAAFFAAFFLVAIFLFSLSFVRDRLHRNCLNV
jgi:hypothetical protein